MLANAVKPWPPRSSSNFFANVLRACYGVVAVCFVSVYWLLVGVRNLIFYPADRISAAIMGQRKPGRTGAWLLSLSCACVIVWVASRTHLFSRGPVSASVMGLVLYTSLHLYRAAQVRLYRSDILDFESLDAMRKSIGRSKVLAWYAAQMRTPDDAIWVRAIVGITMGMVPPTLSLLVPSLDRYITWSWFVLAALEESFSMVMADHFVGHLAPFKTRDGGLSGAVLGLTQLYFDYIATFLDGRVPNLVRAVHNIHHHGENNGANDFETTYPYDRTSFFDCAGLYLTCAISYCFALDSMFYIWKRSKAEFWSLIRGLVFTYGIIVAWVVWDWRAAVFFLCVRFLIAGVRWGGVAFFTHPFVDPDAPGELYSNSLDGVTPWWPHMGNEVHIGHHLVGGCHWTRLKERRQLQLEKYRTHRAVVVPEPIMHFVLPLLFCKRFDVIAKFMVEPEQIEAIEGGGLGVADVARLGRESGRIEERKALLEYRARPKLVQRGGILKRVVDGVAGAITARCVPDWVFRA